MMKSRSNEAKKKDIKIMLIGSSSVGKSSLLMQYSSNKFQSSYSTTIGVDYKKKIIEVDGLSVPVMIWDTAGQDRFKTITNSYYRGADGILIVYDITDQESFLGVQHWLQEIDKYAEEHVQKYIIGNKCDLEEKRLVTKTTAEKYARQIKIPFRETSAKLRINVDETFEEMTRMILQKRNISNARNPPTNAFNECSPERFRENKNETITSLNKPGKKQQSSSCC